MSAASPKLEARKPQARSRVTNGKDGYLLPGVDGRSSAARRYFDLVAALCADAGGKDRVSEVRGQLIRRFASLAVQAEQQEARAALGEPIDLSEFTLISSTMVRLASRLGLDRRAKNITPDPLDYARGLSP